jgi:ribosomal protein S18 acetylase RimI-like enzyme
MALGNDARFGRSTNTSFEFVDLTICGKPYRFPDLCDGLSSVVSPGKRLCLVAQTSSLLPPTQPIIPAGFRQRLFEPEDFAQVAALHFRCFQADRTYQSDAGSRDEFRALYRGDFGAFLPGGCFVVENEGGSIISALFAVTGPPWGKATDSLFVTDIFTDPNYRGRGLARALLVEFGALASRLGKAEIVLCVREDNYAARQLYRALGFSESAP